MLATPSRTASFSKTKCEICFMPAALTTTDKSYAPDIRYTDFTSVNFAIRSARSSYPRPRFGTTFTSISASASSLLTLSLLIIAVYFTIVLSASSAATAALISSSLAPVIVAISAALSLASLSSIASISSVNALFISIYLHNSFYVFYHYERLSSMSEKKTGGLALSFMLL